MSDFQTIITTDTALVALLHISSSAFPVGGFSHSYGFETYMSDGRVKNAKEFSELLNTALSSSMGGVDAPAVCIAHSADIKELSELDALVTALKTTRELRESSTRMGRSFLRIFSQMYPNSMLDEYYARVKRGESDGNYAAVFGAATGLIGADKNSAVCAYLFNSVYSLIQTGIKSVPLGQGESQRVMMSVYEEISRVAERAASMSMDDMGGFSPMLDIASMRHEDLYTRLYMS